MKRLVNGCLVDVDGSAPAQSAETKAVEKKPAPKPAGAGKKPQPQKASAAGKVKKGGR